MEKLANEKEALQSKLDPDNKSVLIDGVNYTPKINGVGKGNLKEKDIIPLKEPSPWYTRIAKGIARGFGAILTGLATLFIMCFYAIPIVSVFNSIKELSQGKHIKENLFLLGMIGAGIAVTFTLAFLFPPSIPFMTKFILTPLALHTPGIILAGATLGNIIGKGLTRLYNYCKYGTPSPHRLDIDIKRLIILLGLKIVLIDLP